MSAPAKRAPAKRAPAKRAVHVCLLACVRSCVQIGNTSLNSSSSFEQTNIGFKERFTHTNKNKNSFQNQLLLGCLRKATFYMLAAPKQQRPHIRNRISMLSGKALLTAVPGIPGEVDMTLVINCSARSYGFIRLRTYHYGKRCAASGITDFVLKLQPEYNYFAKILDQSPAFIRSIGGTLRRLYPSKVFYFSETVNRVASSVQAGAFSNQNKMQYTFVKVDLQGRATAGYMQVCVIHFQRIFICI